MQRGITLAWQAHEMWTEPMNSPSIPVRCCLPSSNWCIPFTLPIKFPQSNLCCLLPMSCSGPYPYLHFRFLSFSYLWQDQTQPTLIQQQRQHHPASRGVPGEELLWQPWGTAEDLDEPWVWLHELFQIRIIIWSCWSMALYYKTRRWHGLCL